MKALISRLGICLAILLTGPLLAACEHTNVGGYTPAQNLYRAHGTYNIVLGTAVTYAESKYAKPAVVQQATDINRRAKPAFEYAAAVIACAGPDSSGNLVIKVVNARCSVLDISAGTIQKNAGVLDWAKGSLLNLLKKG